MLDIIDLKFLAPEVLRNWLTKESKRLIIVDVRDDDFQTGHIRDCFHILSHEFDSYLPQLQQTLLAKDYSDIIFHCALSQVRGPKATLKYLRALNSLREDESRQLDQINVWVLEGGYQAWHRLYGNDNKVTVRF
ncbi:uncharacterized protein KQ657_000892 [Scheffersomyces spartinae]|uniref:Rhodanese domain-containing protein n=1 Tax=Scheffersomyces spartinae TaxID=45513 RepID=A0A9P8AHT9_9ASCO|nr:uncharacterized protein KQ657_000892 [Scheffersomyces spartinae]KAG7193138.1 hypothetical protein KQ657_000892 [Scheffersomyces spartinae]